MRSGGAQPWRKAGSIQREQVRNGSSVATTQRTRGHHAGTHRASVASRIGNPNHGQERRQRRGGDRKTDVEALALGHYDRTEGYRSGAADDRARRDRAVEIQRERDQRSNGSARPATERHGRKDLWRRDPPRLEEQTHGWHDQQRDELAGDPQHIKCTRRTRAAPER